MNKRFIAHIVSYLFHPVVFFLLMPFLVVYRQTHGIVYALKWQIFSGAFVFLGILIIFMEVMKGGFSDFDISKQHERFKFYVLLLILGVLYLFSATYFKGIFFPLSIISVGIGFGIVVFALVNYFIKVSVHVCVATAFVLSTSLLFGQKYFFVTFWIIPLIGWARYRLKQHTMLEVISGSILGGVITLVTFIAGELMIFNR